MPDQYDVIVVGAGNAALCAAIAAKEVCPSVLVVEKAPEYFRGGNTYFTGGIIRFAFDGIEDIQTLIPDMSPTEVAALDVGSYPESEFYSDMMRVTQGLSDPDLAQILVSQSFPTMKWLREKGFASSCPTAVRPSRTATYTDFGAGYWWKPWGPERVCRTSSSNRRKAAAWRSDTPLKA